MLLATFEASRRTPYTSAKPAPRRTRVLSSSLQASAGRVHWELFSDWASMSARLDAMCFSRYVALRL
jgi:hypothetical protein